MIARLHCVALLTRCSVEPASNRSHTWVGCLLAIEWPTCEPPFPAVGAASHTAPLGHWVHLPDAVVCADPHPHSFTWCVLWVKNHKCNNPSGPGGTPSRWDSQPVGLHWWDSQPLGFPAGLPAVGTPSRWESQPLGIPAWHKPALDVKGPLHCERHSLWPNPPAPSTSLTRQLAATDHGWHG